MELTKYEKHHARLRLLIMGLSGTGKSTLAATLARKYHVVWLDCEDAIDVLNKVPAEWKSRIRIIKIPDTATFPIASQTVQRLFKDKKANICDTHGVVECPRCKTQTEPAATFESIDFNAMPSDTVLVLDSLTQIGISFLNHLCKNKPIDYKPERDDWGSLRKNTEYLASNIQGAGINLVVTALPTESSLEDGRVKLIPQFGSNPMCQIIGAKFGTIIYTDVKNKKHIAFSSSTASSVVLTKSRVGFRIEDLPEPDLVPMFDSYLGDRENNGSSENISKDITEANKDNRINRTAVSSQLAQQNIRGASILNSIKK